MCGLGTGAAVFILIRIVLPKLGPEALESLGPLAGLKQNTWWDAILTTIPALVVGVLASFAAAPPSQKQTKGLLLRSAKEKSSA